MKICKQKKIDFFSFFLFFFQFLLFCPFLKKKIKKKALFDQIDDTSTEMKNDQKMLIFRSGSVLGPLLWRRKDRIAIT